jgi:hypothetical protein
MKKPEFSIGICTILFLLVTDIAVAQPGRGMQHRRGQLDAQKIAFITRQLELTPQEAQAFWPVYNEFDAKRITLRQSFVTTTNLENKNIDELSDKEAGELADNQIIQSQKLLDLRKEYHSKFKTVLPIKKVLKLYESERGFQKELLGQIRGNRQKGPPPPPREE